MRGVSIFATLRRLLLRSAVAVRLARMRLALRERLARRGASARTGVAEGSSDHQCDFCGAEEPADDLERLVDGIERCDPCGDTAVETIDDLTFAYRRARRFLTKELSIHLRQDIDIRCSTPAEIAEAVGGQFTATARFDYRAVGRAMFQDDGCAILIELGQPYAMTLATLVHELVHVWQFDHLDIERAERDAGLSLVEGLATWAEVECLRSHGLLCEGADSMEVRDDLYAYGYREIREKAGRTENGPFAWMLSAYGRRF